MIKYSVINKDCKYVDSSLLQDGEVAFIRNVDGKLVSVSDIGANDKVYYMTATNRFMDMSQIMSYGNSMSLPRVGGRIYYINPDVEGDYKFYKEDGTEITDWENFTDLEEAYYYEKLSDNEEDAFYAVNTNFTRDWCFWSSIDSSIIVPTNENDGIGKGKSNTSIIMSTYPEIITSIPNQNPPYEGDVHSIWYYCNAANNSSEFGCNDWYVPSRAELQKMYDAMYEYEDYDNFKNLFPTCNGMSFFLCYTTLSSSEYSDYDVWAKIYGHSMQTQSKSFATVSNIFVCIRSF